MLLQTKYLLRESKKVVAGHIKVRGGPHVARGPDVAQACYITNRIGFWKTHFYLK